MRSRKSPMSLVTLARKLPMSRRKSRIAVHNGTPKATPTASIAISSALNAIPNSGEATSQ